VIQPSFPRVDIQSYWGVFVFSRVLSVLFAGAVLGVAGSPASAQQPSGANWTFDIGPGVLVTPWFEGSANYRVLPIPALELRYKRDRFFISAREGIGATLLDAEGFKAGPVLRYRFSRDQSGNYLNGMGSVPFTVEGGAFLRYDHPWFGVRLEARRGLGGHNGFLFDSALDGRLRLGSGLMLSAGPRLSISDATYNQAFFGVDAAQSAGAGYGTYFPTGGLRSVGVGASAVWRVTDRITFATFGGYNRLGDVPAASPIVTGPGGSADQFTVGSALSWRFSW